MRVTHTQLLFNDYRDWFYTEEDKLKVYKTPYTDNLEVFFGPYSNNIIGIGSRSVDPLNMVPVVDKVPFCYNKLKFIIDLSNEKEEQVYGLRMVAYKHVANRQLLALIPAYYCIVTPLIGRKNEMEPIQIIYLNIKATVPIESYHLEEICNMHWEGIED